MRGGARFGLRGDGNENEGMRRWEDEATGRTVKEQALSPCHVIYTPSEPRVSLCSACNNTLYPKRDVFRLGYREFIPISEAKANFQGYAEMKSTRHPENKPTKTYQFEKAALSCEEVCHAEDLRPRDMFSNILVKGDDTRPYCPMFTHQSPPTTQW